MVQWSCQFLNILDVDITSCGFLGDLWITKPILMSYGWESARQPPALECALCDLNAVVLVWQTNLISSNCIWLFIDRAICYISYLQSIHTLYCLILMYPFSTIFAANAWMWNPYLSSPQSNLMYTLVWSERLYFKTYCTQWLTFP